jgi:fructokinase
MIDIIALGETIVDFISAGVSDHAQKLYEVNAGGSASIVAATAKAMGAESALIGKIGADNFGDFLESTLRKLDVNTQGLVFDPDVFTTMCFVELDEKGKPTYSFVRKPGADTKLEIGELPLDLLENCRILHISGLALTNEPMRGAATVAVDVARESGSLIALDPNYRADIWSSVDEFKARTLNAINKVNILIMDLDEMQILTGEQSPTEGCERLFRKGVELVLIRMGKDGTYIRNHEGDTIVSAFDMGDKVVDCTGAGAVFIGTFLANYAKLPRLSEVALVTIKDIVQLANAASAHSTCVRGGIPSIPTPEMAHEMVMGNH